MKHPVRARLTFALGTLLAWSVPVVEGMADPPDPGPAEKVIDTARQALSKEAKAKVEEREAMFARLKAMPAAPAMALGPQVNRNMFLLRREPVAIPSVLNMDDGMSEESDQADREIIAFDPASFDACVFLSFSTDVAQRTWLDSRLRSKIETAEQNWRLTNVQKGKLLLAGRGDIKRFFDSVHDQRLRFESLRTDLQECRRFLNDLDGLSRDFQVGPFGADSLFSKTFRSIVASERVARP